jgi:hypothetical protein
MNYTLIKKIFLFFGIDMDGRFEGRAHILRFLAIWRRIILLFMVIGVIQIWVHLIGSPSNELQYLTTISIGMLGLQSSLKVYMMNRHNHEMKAHISKIHNFHALNYGQLNNESEKFLNTIFRCNLAIFIFIMTSCNLVFVVDFIKVMVSSIQGTKAEIQFVYALYLPFDEADHQLFTCFYIMALLNTIDLGSFVIDQITAYTVVFLSICFDRLGEEFREVIDGSEVRAFRETKKMLASCIDKHNQLIEICGEVNSIYGISLLVFTLQSSMLICMLGFQILVSVSCCFQLLKQRLFFRQQIRIKLSHLQLVC